MCRCLTADPALGDPAPTDELRQGRGLAVAGLCVAYAIVGLTLLLICVGVAVSGNSG